MDELLKKITESLKGLVTLQITTVVGQVAYDSATDKTTVANAKVIRTVIDLLEGDIKTEIDEAFVTGALQALRDFHAEREKQGSAIVKANIEALEKLFDFALKLKSSQTKA